MDGVKIAVSNTNDVQSLPSVLVLAEPEGNHRIKYKRYLVVADVRVLAEPEGDHCIKYEWQLDGVKIVVSNTNDIDVLGEMMLVQVQVVTVAESFIRSTVTCQTKVVWLSLLHHDHPTWTSSSRRLTWTCCLYLIQQCPKTSLKDPACIWYSERLKIYLFRTLLVFLPIIFLPSLRVWVHFFSFLIYHNASPLATQFQSFFWLPIDIANDLLLVFDTATAQDITFIWYSELDLLILCRTHLWPRHILDFRALFRRPPTSPPLVACIRYGNSFRYSVHQYYCLCLIQQIWHCPTVACIWYSNLHILGFQSESFPAACFTFSQPFFCILVLIFWVLYWYVNLS